MVGFKPHLTQHTHHTGCVRHQVKEHVTHAISTHLDDACTCVHLCVQIFLQRTNSFPSLQRGLPLGSDDTSVYED